MLQAFRAPILHLLDDPDTGSATASQWFPDGLLIVESGRIRAIGPAMQLQPSLPEQLPVQTFGPEKLLIPGFIDTHVHYPQSGIIGAHGTQLLDWLNTYTFPAEAEFADPAHARREARFFLRELLRNGTTSALVFATVHPQSVSALFEQARALDMCLIAGKVLMDRHAPAELLDTPASGYADSRRLIEDWHGRGRLHYAVTPRFAPTSSPAQLEQAGRLLREMPDLYLQTHLAENLQEVAWVRQLFPQQRNYLDVYDHFGLVGPRSVFAHAIHLQDCECQRLGASGSAVAFCPTSNLFLGSGLMDLARLEQHRVRVGLGTDVGAGTSFSLLQTLNEGYKVLQLQQQNLSPFKGLYLGTLGAARALYLDAQIGNLSPGKVADFVVLDLEATPLLRHRMARTRDIAERLFALTMLGDDRAIHSTHVAGQRVYQRPEP